MTRVIDADGHIVEPRFLWQEYTEAKFRDRIPQVAQDNEGIDRIKVEGQLLPRSPLDDRRYVRAWRPEQP